MIYLKAVFISNAFVFTIACILLSAYYGENVIYVFISLFFVNELIFCLLIASIGASIAIGQLLVFIKLGKADLPNTAGSKIIMSLTENRIVAYVALALLPAIAEEILFRAALQTMIGNWSNSYFAILFTSIVFVFAHYSQQYKGQPFILYQVFSISILIGISFEWTGNLIVPILIHLLYNIFSVEVMKRGFVSIR